MSPEEAVRAAFREALVTSALIDATHRVFVEEGGLDETDPFEAARRWFQARERAAPHRHFDPPSLLAIAQLLTLAEGLAAGELRPDAEAEAVRAYLGRADIAVLIGERAREAGGIEARSA